ncbi:MAG: glyoxalase [Proteobacteria bacterium]|nr:glyoxalase [Pseudomonadota bacterium]
MEPRDKMAEFSGGATLNLCVEDADMFYNQLTRNGLSPVIPLEDHPWGDRGFGIIDPCGLVVYCYHPIEPATEYKVYHLNP